MGEWARGAKRGMTSRPIRIGARGSNLSRKQVDYVANLLSIAHPGLPIEIEVIVTNGDRQLDKPLPVIGGKGVFTEELEELLLSGRIDLAVHSLKDLPTAYRPGLTIGATPERATVADVLISRAGEGLADLPIGAVIGTSSLRRGAQIARARHDLVAHSIRGNVETRLRKLQDPDGPYHAILLAAAGLERLGLESVATEELSLETMLPAPGQGALAVQARDQPDMHALLAPIHDASAWLTTSAERAFLSGLGGGCSAPVAAYGELVDGVLTLRGRVSAVDGSAQVDVRSASPCAVTEDAVDAGRRLAERALAEGAAPLIEVVS